MRISDWSSDVCSSDLTGGACGRGGTEEGGEAGRCEEQQSRYSAQAVLRSGLAEEEDHEADEGQGLHEGDAEEHRGPDHAGGLGLAGHGLDGLADQVADADAGAQGPDAVRECCKAGVGDLSEDHERSSLLGLGWVGTWIGIANAWRSEEQTSELKSLLR